MDPFDDRAFQDFNDDFGGGAAAGGPGAEALSPSTSSGMWGEFKPWSGTLLLKGYHPLAGGLLDDTTPLTWTKVHVYLKEPNVIVIKHLDEQRGSSQFEREFEREESAGDTPSYRLGEVSEFDQQVRIDKHLTVTEIKKKNYSNDPAHSIYLEAFSIEKSKDFGVLPFEGLKYKRIKFGVPPAERDTLADFRSRIIDIADKVREVPEEITQGGFLSGLVMRVTGGGSSGFTSAF